MINVYKQNGKLIGVYQILLNKELLQTLTDVKSYVTETLIKELKQEDNSELFTYNILTVNDCEDLFGCKYEVIFEFIPNKEFIEEIKVMTERLGVGL
jgi:hypothetical protein